jgi:Ni/Fe-hydrogenase subunit HybB-like protein
MTGQTSSDLTVVRWQRGVPIFGVPVVTKNFLFLAGIAAAGFALVIYRQVFGLGAASGLSDGFPWGIWKTFNVMTLTALGSGSFPIGIAAWIFHKRKLHAVMRVTLLVSFLVYFTGLLAIAVDVSRPWNVYNLLSVFRWNTVSPMWEVLWCMPLYCLFPLFLENTPPILEQWYYFFPPGRGLVVWLVPVIRKTYPYVVALAYTLPILHQSALGALMLLTGNQVYPLWQTPLLPLLYVWAAAFIGTATTIGSVLLCCLTWKRPIDQSIMDELVSLMNLLIFPWIALRLLDVVVRGRFLMMFNSGFLSLLFWAEMLCILVPAYYLRQPKYRNSSYHLFRNCFLIVIGGMLYRFDPTTFAYRPWRVGIVAYYTPSVIEVIISLSFICTCICLFMIAVKKLPILPAPMQQWYDLESYYRNFYPYIQMSGHVNADQHRPSYAD